MPKPCQESHGDYHEGCRLCWLNLHEQGYRDFWERSIAPSRFNPIALPIHCIHLGSRVHPPLAPDVVRDWRQCEKGHGVICSCMQCRTCVDFEPDHAEYFGSVKRRHLLYHLLPVAGNGVWQRGIDQLRLRWDLFTGRRIVAIMTGPPIKTQGSNPRLAELDSPSVVRSYLPSNCEVIEVQNDPSRWEAASWPHLWSHILHDSDAEDAVLYCHAKGVTRPAIIAHEFGGTAQNWANLLYTLNLDYWPLVEAQLRRHPIVGAFRKGGHFFQAAGLTSAGMAASAWHYSGNFWWVRAGDFRHRWPKVAMPADRWGAEA